mmetsp:Transcript_22419/g.62165  ORF Transcript_22419/g.62165 Transcript_22419/m.62165 type:complete len:220 (+) Transcript_22419:720-1379(+)
MGGFDVKPTTSSANLKAPGLSQFLVSCIASHQIWYVRKCNPWSQLLYAANQFSNLSQFANACCSAVQVKLKSSDDQYFEVEEEVAFESLTVKNMIEDTGTEAPIPLPNVSSKILAKVIEYCKYHVDAKSGDADKPSKLDDDIKAWDMEFVKVDQGTLFELILAANYLNIKSLLDLTCLTVANMIKGKTPEEIRKTFDIKNDFTPEEEEEVRKENQWAFE